MPQSFTNGVQIEYETRGSGEPLLLIMGLGAQMVAWPEDFIDDMVRRGFQVIWFDNRDVGLSSKIPVPAPTLPRQLAAGFRGRSSTAPYLLTDMAADALGVPDTVGVGQANIVGVSMGGMIAQTMAIEHPDRIRSLTSIMSNTGDRRHGLTRVGILWRLRKLMEPAPDEAIENQVKLFRLIGGPLVDDDEVRAGAILAFQRDFDRSGVARQLAAVMASPDRTKALGDIAVPTLIIHGLSDVLVGPSGGLATAKAVAHSRLLMFRDMGHDLPRELWPEMIDAIVANTQRTVPSPISVVGTN